MPGFRKTLVRIATIRNCGLRSTFNRGNHAREPGPQSNGSEAVHDDTRGNRPNSDGSSARDCYGISSATEPIAPAVPQVREPGIPAAPETGVSDSTSPSPAVRLDRFKTRATV